MADALTGSNDREPSSDFFDQLRRFGETAIPTLLRQLEDELSTPTSGKKRPLRFNCIACGRENDVDVPTQIDVKQRLEVINAVRLAIAEESKQAKADAVGSRAGQLLRDKEDMTDEQIAEQIAALEVELADEDRS